MTTILCVDDDHLLTDFLRVVLEHEPGRVRRRAAGLPQRTLVEKDDAVPALLGQVVGNARAGDPAADDHHAGGAGKRGARDRIPGALRQALRRHSAGISP